MLIKICGIKEPENMVKVATLSPDMLGFIFYEASLRYVGNLSSRALEALPENIEKVGVFVNAGIEYIEDIVKRYTIRTIQLHGNESPEVCLYFKEKGFRVIKALGVEKSGDFQQVQSYESSCHWFLFDTKSKQYGGTGQAFDWKLLEEYNGTLPFLLSGGISWDNREDIRKISHPQFAGIDLNSRFESSPGVKNVSLLSHFLSELY